MPKKFNITGTCYPQQHYIMDNRAKVNATLSLIKDGEYFTINRPRQYGKTTTLFFLATALEKLPDYLPIELNFQGIDDAWHESDQAFAKMFVQELTNALQYTQKEGFAFLQERAKEVEGMRTLSSIVTDLVHRLDKKLILIIDEVDASSNYDSFLNFLGMLRTKYLARHKAQHLTFHSIVLAGVHDIKTLKQKIRTVGDTEYNSPWNIATDFKVDMSFDAAEIATMLQDYQDATDTKMEVGLLSERLHYYTAGYPFLVSKLCKLIAEDIIPATGKQDWTVNDLEAAVLLLLKENNTNFDSLIKNLEGNSDLYELVRQLLIEGMPVPFNQHNPTIHRGVLYGVFKNNGRLKIHNRIYEQLIYNYMTSKVITNSFQPKYVLGQHFLLPDNALDMPAILLRF